MRNLSITSRDEFVIAEALATALVALFTSITVSARDLGQWDGPNNAELKRWYQDLRPAAVKREDGSYLISGWMPAVEFAQLLGITLPTSRPYQTFAGFLLQEFGTIPGIGDRIEAEGWRFEIVDLDGRRIDKVLASRLEAS